MSSSEHIVGMMWNKNEGDILEEIIQEALPFVDSLMIADDGSSDNSWDIIQSMSKKHDKIEHIQQKPNSGDKGQRQALLDKVKERYKSEDTWVQVIESDMMIAPFVDLRRAIQDNTVGGVALYWRAWNAIRLKGTWDGVDIYPKWTTSIKEVLPLMHPMENMLYTFRPIEETTYLHSNAWRPWPSGMAKYIANVHKREKYKANTPVVLHYGYRGPTHFYNKYKGMGGRHTRYKNWDLTSPEAVERTVDFFNGVWGKKAFEPNMEAFRRRKRVKN